jgi:hypothetical protein
MLYTLITKPLLQCNGLDPNLKKHSLLAGEWSITSNKNFSHWLTGFLEITPVFLSFKREKNRVARNIAGVL